MRLEEYLTNEFGGGQYFTPEEDELFKERTYDSLKKLEKLGWRIEYEQPSFSGTLYRLWNNGRSRALYLSEKRLYQGKATIGKLVAAQQRLKLAKHRGNKENIKKYQELIVQLEKGLREAEEYSELFGEQIEMSKTQYKSLNDAGNINDGLKKGSTEIWYMKDKYFRDFNMGYKFIARHVPDLLGLPLKETHVLLGKIREKKPEKIMYMMQGEFWSPYGEANALIRKMGLTHTSMSVGDVIVIGKKKLMVDRLGGFKELP